MKRTISILLAAVMLLSLAACGSGKSDRNDAPGDELTADDVSETADSAGADAADANGVTVHRETLADGSVIEWKSIDCPLSEYLSGGQTIWYHVAPGGGALGRESNVKEVFVLEQDGSMVYTDPDMNLGQMARMTDEEIIAMVHTAYEENVAERASDPFNMADEPAGGHVMTWTLSDSLINQFYGNDPLTEEAFYTMCEEYYGLTDHNEAVWSAYADASAALEGLCQQSGSYIIENLIYYSANGSLTEADYPYYSEATGIPESELKDFSALTVTAIETANEALDAHIAAKKAAEAAALEALLADIPASEYRLSIVTDPTGNNTEAEMFAYQYPSYIEDGELQFIVRSLKLNQDWSAPDEDGLNGNCTTTVYDSLYGGYIIWEKNVEYFFTRVDANCYFQLDEVGADGVPIDEDAASLFS